MKKALIYDPYIDTLGGGERYILTFALGLIKNGYSVVLAWPSKNELKSAELRFGLDLSNISIDEEAYNLCSQKSAYTERLQFTKEYDLIFWVSDGSLPFLFSKNNIIHFQVPFKKLGGNPTVNNLKNVFVKKFVYNSDFTRNVLERNLPKDKGFVLYPPIDVDSITPGMKENIILSVARFDSPSHGKRQDVLIDAFKKLVSNVKNYKLILAGGLKGDEIVLQKIIKQSKGFPIEFVVNPDFTELKKLYSKAKFFWHAAGYEVNEQTDPDKVEHFGMTTVEAMASGCVPVVINKGGQKEIITPGTGFLCEDLIEIAEKSIELINTPVVLTEMSKNAVIRSRFFSTANFYEKIKTLL
ncbi:MAG: Glycosyl transferase [Microgenomates group bacterium GW2011_GWC1_44_37]|uniref:Glycosyl transferase n=1 Tax=Candidatus Collierbacteria bacterium GW2011_GWB2_44_22 TaxID=1618387 RepID=A0A0G1HYE3_9BACT|nr:MAG: Glycosyl transferase [Candidatus Collierbacteria bacterium GW2011_GWB1_44_197]KKT52161.1 MAG: Glycosyl transferase [Candidatus Collierbacteria bacterium GW2011_GWB2_44_22]KKT62325.1 MAG: Glycosyl transferase [Candidatus Collierbacteria bacterium GW2011_GWD1_44_27]KKT65872.1 MAG: Glycosyl transferase [Candidatus Collierbacteria bacterium GW2011_GWC2_44_30]KKT68615.1 MAG: Glycosyl transferase [Microgenomates group bacterium GW2011_GWC1_44_37]